MKETALRDSGVRNDYIDIAKSLGMLTVMWGHIKLTGMSNAFVYAFHMPLFFFLSGMVFSHSKYPDFKTFINRKIRTLLIPYAIFSVFWWCVWASFSYVTHAEVESYWMPLLETLIAQGSEGFLVHNVPLWFVPCLFVVEVFYYFISLLPKIGNAIICVACAILGYVLIYHCSFFDFTLLPWSIEVALLALVFYSAGSIIVESFGHDKMRFFANKKSIVPYLIMVLGWVVVYVVAKINGSITMGHAFIGQYPLLFYIGAFAGVFAMLLLCLILESTEQNKNDNSLFKATKWFGKNSFNAMAIHNPIKGFVIVIVAILFSTSKDSVQANTLYSIITFVITLIVTVLCMLAINYAKKKRQNRQSKK